MTVKTITTKIYETDNKSAHFRISYEENQKELIKGLCVDALADVKKLPLPSKINVSRTGLQIAFEINNSKTHKSMVSLITQAIKDLK